MSPTFLPQNDQPDQRRVRMSLTITFSWSTIFVSGHLGAQFSSWHCTSGSPVPVPLSLDPPFLQPLLLRGPKPSHTQTNHIKDVALIKM